MVPKSIRWRLPLSYAVIALLTVLALGAVLLTRLQRYYLEQELAYLQASAQGISQMLALARQQDVPLSPLHAQLNSIAYFAQVRVQLLDAQGGVIVDSNDPDMLTVYFVSDQFTRMWEDVVSSGGDPGYSVVTPFPGGQSAPEALRTGVAATVLRLPAEASAELLPPALRGDASAPMFQPSIVVISTALADDLSSDVTFNYGLSFALRGDVQLSRDDAQGAGAGEAVQIAGPWSVVFARPSYTNFLYENAPADIRSDMVYTEPVADLGAAWDGAPIHAVRLSEGPAYGREIVASVARGWVMAGTVATVLAAGVGWALSRRLTAPLLALTRIAERRAAGDLSARTDIASADEVGALARAFNAMAARVEETIAALRRFVADAAHELHTPLTALRTNLELADTAAPDDVHRSAYLERAQAQVARLETLTADLLDLSRIEAGTFPEAFAPVALAALVQEISELYASQAEQADVDFTLDLPPEGATIHGSAAQLRRALCNLLDNALKFTPARGAIRVTLRQAGDQAVLAVEDTGIGIPAADVPHLFNRFHRARNASAYPGSGLGLAIVRAIAEAHGGGVTVESSGAGAGARFTLCLPAVTARPTRG